MLPALALLPLTPDMAVLDLCAAPGSKTLHLLDLMHAPAAHGADALYPTGILVTRGAGLPRPPHPIAARIFAAPHVPSGCERG